MRTACVLICLLSVTACRDESALGPTVSLNERFTLAPGNVAVLARTDLRIQFVDVVGDSRCPADAVCIQGGDAMVRVQVHQGRGVVRSYELHTGDTARASVVHDGVRITLVDLQPYPFSSRSTAPGDYRATFMATR